MRPVTNLRQFDLACWNCRRPHRDHDVQVCISAPYPGATSNRYEPRGDRGWVA